MMFDELWNHAHAYYSGGEPLAEDNGVGDYVAEAGGGLTPAGFVEGVRDFDNPQRCHLFRWGLGEVVTAVAGAGLRITVLQEYPYSNGERHFAEMRELPGRRMVPPESVPSVPLMYGIRACKGGALRREEEGERCDEVDAAQHSPFKPVRFSIEGDKGGNYDRCAQGDELQGSEDQVQGMAEKGTEED